MVKLQKRLARLRQKSKDTDSTELIAILTELGFECRAGKGSHTVCKHPDLPEVRLTIPHQKPLKEVYVKKVLHFIQPLLEEENG